MVVCLVETRVVNWVEYLDVYSAVNLVAWKAVHSAEMKVVMWVDLMVALTA
jgi:hypothetical protein